MPKVTITLDRNDLGQIIDGLAQRMESYNHTVEFLDDESQNLDNLLIEEVRDSAEARNLTTHYKRIIGDISRQLNKPTEPQA